jgi:hypothetical protein
MATNRVGIRDSGTVKQHHGSWHGTDEVFVRTPSVTRAGGHQDHHLRTVQAQGSLYDAGALGRPGIGSAWSKSPAFRGMVKACARRLPGRNARMVVV